MKMKTEETIKLIKYVTGSVAAVLLAAALQLQFAYAAGIITLLTIQDTKKETVRITAKRMIIFVIMTILSAVIFPLAGYHVWAFGIVLIPYLFSCMALDMKEAIAPIAVLYALCFSKELQSVHDSERIPDPGDRSGDRHTVESLYAGWQKTTVGLSENRG